MVPSIGGSTLPTRNLASDNEKASAKMSGRGFQPIGREWEKNFPITACVQLSSHLSEKLMALADKGITKPEELCKRALKGFPRRAA